MVLSVVACCWLQAFALVKAVINARHERLAKVRKALGVFMNSKTAAGFRTWVAAAKLIRHHQRRITELGARTDDEGGVGMVALAHVAADREAIILDLLQTVEFVGQALHGPAAGVDETIAGPSINTEVRSLVM